MIEQSVHLADVLLEQQLTGQQVAAGLRRVVQGIRGGTFQKSGQSPDSLDHTAIDATDIVLQCIPVGLREHLQGGEHPVWPTIAGVARSILGSVESHSTASPVSRGYLDFIEGLLQQFRANFQRVSRHELMGSGLAAEVFLDQLDQEADWAFDEGDDGDEDEDDR